MKEVIVLLTVGWFSAQALEWRNCDSLAPVQVESLYVRPDPIILSAGSNITFGGGVEIKTDLGASYTISVELKKKLSLFWLLLDIWVPIPCFRDVGSCTYTGIQCEEMTKYLNTTCPPGRGKINLKEHAVVIPKLVSSLLKGDFRGGVELRQEGKANKRLACIQTEFSINK